MRVTRVQLHITHDDARTSHTLSSASPYLYHSPIHPTGSEVEKKTHFRRNEHVNTCRSKCCCVLFYVSPRLLLLLLLLCVLGVGGCVVQYISAHAAYREAASGGAALREGLAVRAEGNAGGSAFLRLGG